MYISYSFLTISWGRRRLPNIDKSLCFSFKATQIAGYFHKIYIRLNKPESSVGRPLFAINFWNVNKRTKNDDHWTNNQIEGWHKRFQSVLSCGNPGFFTCVKALKREQVSTTNKVNRLQAGFLVKKEKQLYCVKWIYSVWKKERRTGIKNCNGVFTSYCS